MIDLSIGDVILAWIGWNVIAPLLFIFALVLLAFAIFALDELFDQPPLVKYAVYVAAAIGAVWWLLS